MRFALIATGAAAIATLPMLAAISGPRMDGADFVAAVRCVAAESALGRSRDFAEERYLLNLEAQLQPIETTRQAQAEARSAAREAAHIVNSDDTAIVQTLRAACADGAVLADGARAPDAA